MAEKPALPRPDRDIFAIVRGILATGGAPVLTEAAPAAIIGGAAVSAALLAWPVVVIKETASPEIIVVFQEINDPSNTI
jgi:flagellar motor component MotA